MLFMVFSKAEKKSIRDFDTLQPMALGIEKFFLIYIGLLIASNAHCR